MFLYLNKVNIQKKNKNIFQHSFINNFMFVVLLIKYIGKFWHTEIHFVENTIFLFLTETKQEHL